MSLLINESYANPAKPLWLGATGGTVNGNLTVTGLMQATEVASTDLVLTDIAGNPSGSIINTSGSGAANQLNLYSRQEIDFGRQGGTVNTKLILSAPGTNLDNLVVGGNISAQSMSAGAGMAGTATILLGTTNVIIPSAKVTASSLIFLSHAGAGALGPGAGPAQGNLTYRAADIVPGVSFRVNLTDSTGVIIAASLVDVPLVWMVVN